jgi:plastocyanin
MKNKNQEQKERSNTVISNHLFNIISKSLTMFLSIFVLASIFLLQTPFTQASAAEQTVTIPYGASDPNFSTVAPQWYMPAVITIQVNQTITWVNQDTEGHTVTSGKSGGRTGLVQNNMGQPSGLFDSGTFKPGKSWSYTFTKAGQYEYFCTIHPWMDGYVVVNENESDATDADGNKITKFPIIRYVSDKTIEADLSWEPHYIITGHKITFVYQFYDNVKYKPIPAHYVLTITQNGQELFKRDDSTQFGGGYSYFKFDNPGPVIFRFDDIAHTGQSVQYSTIVEQANMAGMQGMSGMDDNMVEPARNMDVNNSLIPLFFTPTFIALGAIFFMVKIRKKIKRS